MSGTAAGEQDFRYVVVREGKDVAFTSDEREARTKVNLVGGCVLRLPDRKQVGDLTPALDELSEYVASELGLRMRMRQDIDGRAQANYMEVEQIDFTLKARKPPKTPEAAVQYHIVSMGVSAHLYSPWGETRTIFAVSVRVEDGNTYTAVLPKAKVDGSGYVNKDNPSLADVILTGITEAEYTDAYNRAAKLVSKAEKLRDKFIRCGSGQVDLSGFEQQAGDFLEKWGKGETWGSVKNVVPVVLGYAGAGGKMYDVGAVLNRSEYTKSLETQDYLGWNLFKTVLRDEIGGSVAHKGYELLDFVERDSLREIVQPLVDARQVFNETVIAPWRVALGKPEYQHG